MYFSNMLIEYKRDKEYTFDVKEVNTEKRFSILSDGVSTHFYPRILNEKLITLKIKSVKDNRLSFYLKDEIFWSNKVGKDILTRIIEKKKIERENKPPFYLLICHYLEKGKELYQISVKAYNWQMLDEFQDNKVVVCVSKSHGSTFFIQKTEDLIHPIYIIGETYSFRFKGLSEETYFNNYGIEDVNYYIDYQCAKTQLEYKIHRRYGSHRLKKEEIVELKYYGLNKKGVPALKEIDFYFIDKEHIFKTKRELSIIFKDYLVNSILLEQLDKQYLDHDNKWVLSLSSYLSQTIKSKLVRSDFNDLKELIEAHLKLITFIKKTKFYLAFAVDSQLKTKKAIERSERMNQDINVIYNYIYEYGVEDILMNKEVDVSLQLSIFCDLIKYFSFTIISKSEVLYILDQLFVKNELTNYQYTTLFLTLSNYYIENGDRYDHNFYLDKSKRKNSLEKIVDDQDIQILKKVLLFYHTFDLEHNAIKTLYITSLNFYILFKGILESNQTYLKSAIELFFNNKIKLQRRERFSIDKILNNKIIYDKFKIGQIINISYENIVDNNFCFIAFKDGNYLLSNNKYKHYIISQIKSKQDLSFKIEQTLLNVNIVNPIVSLNNSMELKLDSVFKGIVKSKDSYNNYYVSLGFDDCSESGFIDAKLEPRYNKSLNMFSIDIGEYIDVYIHKFNDVDQPCLTLKDQLTSNCSTDMDVSYVDNRYDFNHLFRYLSELFISSKSLKDQEKYLVFIRYIGALIKTPRTFLLQILWEFYNIIDGLSKNLDITAELEALSNNNSLIRLKKNFPNLNNLEKIIEIISSRNLDLIDMVNNINNNTGIYQRIQRLILVQKLLTDESITVKNSINKNIIELIKEGTTSLFLGQSEEEESDMDSPNIDIYEDIIRKIEAGVIYEDNQYEFKETLRCPVLSKEQLKQIKYLESQISDKQDNIELYKQINEIQNINIKEKNHQNIVLLSTFKNICGMLNSNNGGYIVLGIRDEPVELIGLESDYKLNTNYDGLQLYFSDRFKDLFKDSTTYMPYVIPKRVFYKDKEFMIIQIEVISDFDNACFLHYEGKDKCYVRNHGNADEISGETLYNFKRNIKKITHKDPCSVYLMKDEDNNIKIGKSKDPNQRNKTLTAKSHSITLLYHKEFSSRFIAGKIEKALHRQYTNFQIGKSEWFKLGDVDYEDVRSFISDQDAIYNK